MLGVTSCGGSELPRARNAARLPLQVLDKAQGGVRIATLPRATPGVVQLLLYVDAGSRDAHTPQTATLSAWLAVQSGGASIEPTVFPDASEFALACTPAELNKCVEQLARVLATRTPPEDALQQARVRLRDGQRRALAHDPLQTIDALSLQALLGPPALGFFPLGAPDSDVIAAADDVRRFLADHYGPTRTLLVAAGDVDPALVRQAVTDGFARAPRAAAVRGMRDTALPDAPRLNVSFDDQGAIGLAIAAQDLAALQGVVHELTQSLARAEPRIELLGSAFAVRSGALAMLRARASDPEVALERATRELARLMREPPAARPRALASDDLLSGARQVGLEYGAESPVRLPGLQFGAALLLAAGPDAGPLAQNEQLNAQAARMEHAQTMFERALSGAAARTRGDIDQYVASVTTDNGAHVDIQFTQGADVAIALRVGVGAERDSPLLHGQAALLSMLTTTACAGMGPELVRTRFADLGATLEPRVDGESYGVLVRVPKDHWQSALDLALRCMRSPSREPYHLIEAALQLQARLRKHNGALVLRARAGTIVAPRAPGAMSPWGDPERVPNLTPRDLEQALQAAQQGERWAVAVVGPVDVQQALQLCARRLADLTSGTAPQKAAPRYSEPSAVLPSEPPRSRDGSGAKLIAVWTTRGAYHHAFGARLFARALSALLSAVPGVEPLWHDGAVYRETAFAALALRIRPDLSGSVGTLLSGAAQSIDDAWLEKALEPALAEEKRAGSAREAQFAVRAERMARERLGAVVAEPDASDTKKLLQALRDARPGWASAP